MFESVYDVLRDIPDDEIEESITIDRGTRRVDPMSLLQLRETIQPGFLTQGAYYNMR